MKGLIIFAILAAILTATGCTSSDLEARIEQLEAELAIDKALDDEMTMVVGAYLETGEYIGRSEGLIAEYRYEGGWTIRQPISHWVPVKITQLDPGTGYDRLVYTHD